MMSSFEASSEFVKRVVSIEVCLLTVNQRFA